MYSIAIQSINSALDIPRCSDDITNISSTNIKVKQWTTKSCKSQRRNHESSHTTKYRRSNVELKHEYNIHPKSESIIIYAFYNNKASKSVMNFLKELPACSPSLSCHIPYIRKTLLLPQMQSMAYQTTF